MRRSIPGSGRPDHGFGLDLHEPARIEQRRHDPGRRRSRRCERLSVRAADLVDEARVADEDSSADHLVEARACLGERPFDDREADTRLLVGRVGRVCILGHDRRGTGHPDAVADADGARVADALLEDSSRRDVLPLHAGSVAAVEALRQVDRWACENVAVAVTGAVEAVHGDLDRVFPWASVTKLATAVAMLVAAEEGLVDLDEPA